MEEFESFYFFDSHGAIKHSIIGIVAGMMYSSGFMTAEKPILAFSRLEDGSIKASARATRELVRLGVNLGKALNSVCVALGEGNEGNGHKIAAGAKIRPECRNEFLKRVDATLKAQYLQGGSSIEA